MFKLTVDINNYYLRLLSNLSRVRNARNSYGNLKVETCTRTRKIEHDPTASDERYNTCNS